MSEQGLKFILNHKSYAHIRNVKKPAFEYLLPVPGSYIVGRSLRWQDLLGSAVVFWWWSREKFGGKAEKVPRT